MRFEPKTEAELARAALIKPGEYDFEVVNATEEISKSGNEMIKLRLKIFAGEAERSMFAIRFSE
jgi:hypothetical protein